MLPRPLTHLSAFASLNKDHLKPHDTINAIARAGSFFHGTVELTWAWPTRSSPASDCIVITGTDGWLSVNLETAIGSGVPTLRVTIKSTDGVGGDQGEKEEIFGEPIRGVQLELASFFDAISGIHEGPELGDPMGALQDVAFIQAALHSEGTLVDLTRLVSSSA